MYMDVIYIIISMIVIDLLDLQLSANSYFYVNIFGLITNDSNNAPSCPQSKKL